MFVKSEKVWPKGLSRVAKNTDLVEEFLAAYNELSAVKTSRKTNSSIPARAEAKVIEAWNVPGFYCRCELRRKLAVLQLYR